MERHFYAIDPKRKLISDHSFMDKDFLLKGAPYLMKCYAFPSIIYGLFHKQFMEISKITPNFEDRKRADDCANLQ